MAKIQTSKVCWLPNFFTTRCVHWVLDWHTSQSPPHWAHLCLTPSTPVCDHPTVPLHVCEYMRHWSTRHFWRSFSVQPPPFSGKKRTQFSKFEVVESKYRRFNRARWQLTAKKCDQKFPFGSNSTFNEQRLEETTNHTPAFAGSLQVTGYSTVRFRNLQDLLVRITFAFAVIALFSHQGFLEALFIERYTP